MKRPTSWALWFRSLLFLLLAGRSWGQQQEAGLFPPVDFRTSFSSFRSVTATSTCDPCTRTGCTSCNNTCPFGQDSPEPVKILEEGELSSGVVGLMQLTVHTNRQCSLHACACTCMFNSCVVMYFCLYLQTQTSDTAPNEAAIFRFDGSSESYINVTQELRFQPSQGFTITGWVQQRPGNSG